ncbi:DHH family phosphoesterase, partial [Patescibacteria group bacterium]|nr:DHH family phosphoesterase [Patescibacteria group bacterium]
GENRVLEKFGLMVLNKSKRQGLRKIIDFARGEMGKLDTQSIGFQIGPRLNAAGRIQSAKLAFEALVAETKEEAEHFASELEILNRQRQYISDSATKEAIELINEATLGSAIVVWKEGWNPGVIGLVAGKLVSKYGKPAFVLTKTNNNFVGSGRSASGMNLVKAMNSAGNIYLKSGGHPEACGLSILEENLEIFKSKIFEFSDSFFSEKNIEQKLDIDVTISEKNINMEFAKNIAQLAPFGQGNPRPVFLIKNLAIVLIGSVGKTKDHLRLKFEVDSGRILNGIGFGLGKMEKDFFQGDIVDVAFEIGINSWNGTESVQLVVLDIAKS